MSHYKPYPAYKDSGAEWLGQVPEHWGVTSIKRLVSSIEQGWSPDCESRQAEKDEWAVLKVGCVNGGVFRPAENKALPSSLEPKPQLGLRKGDVLVSRANTRELVGGCVVVTQEYPRLLLCDKLYRLGSGIRVTPEFLAAMITVHGRRAVEVEANGASSSMVNIAQSVILNLPVGLPSLDEQASIVSGIARETTRIDALVEKKTCFIELLREKRQALITHAVTKGLDPTVKMRESGVEWLGEVPEHWEVSPLKYIVAFRSGGTPSKDNLAFWDGDIPWASAKDLKVDQLHDTQDHLTELAIASNAASLISAGSVLVVVRGMILARIFPVVEAMVPMAINQDLKALQASKKLEGKFLAHLLRGLASESLRRLEEAGHGTKALRMEAWTSMQLTVPPVGEQRLILAYLDSETERLDNLLSKTERSIELLKERRSALITAAVTGQIDLREAV